MTTGSVDRRGPATYGVDAALIEQRAARRSSWRASLRSARYLVVLLIGFRALRADVGTAMHERVESAGPMTASSTS
jgi:hypothetical protein